MSRKPRTKDQISKTTASGDTGKNDEAARLADAVPRKELTDNHSDKISLFWGIHHDLLYLGVICSLALGTAWFAFAWWVIPGRDTQLKVIVGLILACFTLLAAPLLLIFVAGVLVVPVAIIHSIYALLISRWIVVTTYRFGKDESTFPQCRLCSTCQTLVASPLLAGSPWLLVRSLQRYPFHDTDNLRRSAEDCHLCNILLHSIEPDTRPKPLQAPPAAQLKPPKVETESFTSLLHKEGRAAILTEIASPVEVRFGPINSRKPLETREPISEQLSVKIWMESFCLRRPILRMQICGSSSSSSTILKVERSAASDDPSRHKCFHSQRTDSPDTLAWANLLVEDCHQNHGLCRRRFVPEESEYYLPLRLLDVDNGTTSTVSLVATMDLSVPSVEYLALSHCWGGIAAFSLREDNIKAMGSIKISDLPRNFDDAISIARRLRVRYLWIDTLCIVQDDEEEWKFESTNMGLVYANAKCVISATGSEDSNGGCYQFRDLHRNDCVVHQTGKRQLVVRSQTHTTLRTLFQEKVEGAPLTKRGWAFQERYLASRILHFCSGSVLFECNDVIASDHDHAKLSLKCSARQGVRRDGQYEPNEENAVAVQDLPPTHNQYALSKRIFKYGFSTTKKVQKIIQNPGRIQPVDTVKYRIPESARSGLRGTFDSLCRFSGSKDLSTALEFHNSWYEMIEHYSGRNLTRQEDKLMAITGVASFIQENTELVYNSGMWEDIMPFNLLWTLASKPKVRPSRRVPTWSWASVDGKICHRLRDVTPPLADDLSRSSWEDLVSRVPENVRVYGQEKVNDLVMYSRLEMTCKLWLYIPGTLNVIWDTLAPPNGYLFALPVLSFKNQGVHPQNSGWQLHGILLREHSKDTFERVAYFWTTERSGYELFSEENRRAFRTRKIVLI
jgi:hypothetical protein